MTSKERRGELRSRYDQRPREAAVYALRNLITGRSLIASTADLASIRNRLEFGISTNSTGVLDRRLVADARAHGMGSFVIDVLDVLDPDPNGDETQTTSDLKQLEELWREKLAEEPHY